jgi:hypothetical protein
LVSALVGGAPRRRLQDLRQRMVVLNVDDLGIANSNKNNLKKLFSNLESKGLNFTCKGTFTNFLGINLT